MYFISLFCYLYAILIFFSLSIYSSNVGICLITSFQAWFLIMAPSHYSLLSGFLLNFVLFLHSSLVLFVNFFSMGFLSVCSFANNLNLCGPVTGHPCPGSPPFSPPPPFVPPPPISVPGNLPSAAIALSYRGDFLAWIKLVVRTISIFW